MTTERLGMTRGGYAEPITRTERRDRIALLPTPDGQSCDERVIRGQDGCWIARHCLECPLPICVLDSRRLARLLHKRDRDGEIRRLLNSGAAARVISEQIGVSLRTVARVSAAQVAESKWRIAATG